MSFLDEIKQRKVFQVAAVYAVVAWLIIQVVGAVSEPLNLPGWVDAVVIVLLAVGFPIAVILGWAYDITPEGIRSSSNARRDGSKERSVGQQFGYISQALVLIAVLFLVVDQYLIDAAPDSSSGNVSVNSEQSVRRFDYHLPQGQELPGIGVIAGALALSPDGQQIVYSTEEGLFLRSMDTLEPRSLPGTVGFGPSFSPDSQSIVYLSPGGHKRVSIRGGVPVALNDDDDIGDPPPVPRWGADGNILFWSERGGIYRQPEAGGAPELLLEIPAQYEAYGPALLPGGDALLFSLARRGSNTWYDAQIVVQSLATGERRVLVEHGRDARYVPSGHLVYAVGDVLYGVAFDAATLTVSGVAEPLVQDIISAGVGIDAPSANFDIADDGTLVYLTGDATAGRSAATLAWVDRTGNEEPIGLEPRIYVYPRLSPDGSRIAFAIRETENDIWVGDLTRRTLTQLSLTGDSLSPVWSTDGTQLIYGASGAIITQRFDGSARAEPLLENTEDGRGFYPRSISPDGRMLLVSSLGPPRDIGLLRLDGGTQIEPLIATPAEEVSPELSPDGRWLAYDSDESGRFEVYVRPFPNVGDSRVQISTRGGQDPLFSRDGSELFYWVDPGTIMSVAISHETNGTLSAGAPRVVVQGDYRKGNALRQYDVSADGERFVVLKRAETAESEPARIVIVQNWVQELARLVSAD